mmetsp:Transcript_16991/g.36997  ORF Transcript_16991/g.36997 Transcript_16991/m.36997 type:complete len:313 (-) Transcript_16991:207-1145(-)
MLLEMNQWHLGYQQLLSDVRTAPSLGADGRTSSPQSIAQLASGGGGGTILILVNPDVDALSAARIVTYALRADNVPYQLRPCGGYAHLVRILTKLRGDGRIGPSADGSSKAAGGGDGSSGLHGVGRFDDDDDFADDDGDFNEDYGVSPEAGGGNGGGGGAGDIRAVVLLNLGANRNLTRFYRPNGLKERPASSPDGGDGNDDGDGDHDDDPNNNNNKHQPPLLPPTTRLYVLDSHRPYHLSNIHSARSVVLFNDRAWDEHVPSDGDNLSGEEVTTDDDSDDSSSSDEDEDEEDLGAMDAEGSGAEAEFDDNW